MRKPLVLFALICLLLCGCSNNNNNSNSNDSSPLINTRFNLTEELVLEKWCDIETGESVMEFYKTGTGRFEGPTHSFEFVWTKIEGFDNAIRFEFNTVLNVAGATKDWVSDYELIEIEGVPTLNHLGDGMSYIRISDFAKER